MGTKLPHEIFSCSHCFANLHPFSQCNVSTVVNRKFWLTWAATSIEEKQVCQQNHLNFWALKPAVRSYSHFLVLHWFCFPFPSFILFFWLQTASNYNQPLRRPSIIMAGEVSRLQGIQRSNKWVMGERIFLLPFPFCSLGLHLLFQRERQRRRGELTLPHTHTHFHHSPFYQFASEISLKSENAGPFPSSDCPSLSCLVHQIKVFPPSVLCGHMPVSSSSRFRLCSLLQEVSLTGFQRSQSGMQGFRDTGK